MQVNDNNSNMSCGEEADSTVKCHELSDTDEIMERSLPGKYCKQVSGLKVLLLLLWNFNKIHSNKERKVCHRSCSLSTMSLKISTIMTLHSFFTFISVNYH